MGWSPWRAVVGFGVVSLAADMVYEGARSITGPLLASLGASAVLVGLITGAGEAMALVLRLVFGSWADRSGRYWTLTFAGYALTAVCVPALAVTPFLAGAGLVVACVLILAERTGKAVRSPAKTALLAHAAAGVGLGRGFAVHKALDQLGAVAGPLLVAGLLAATGAIWPAMAVLVVPGAVAVVILLWIRHRSAGAGEATSAARPPRIANRKSPGTAGVVRDLPRRFWLFAARRRRHHRRPGHFRGDLLPPDPRPGRPRRRPYPSSTPPPWRPQPWPRSPPAGCTSGSRAASCSPSQSGRRRSRPRVRRTPTVAIAGVVLWGAATGVQDSTVKALVADLVPRPTRHRLRVFAAIQGATAIAGGPWPAPSTTAPYPS